MHIIFGIATGTRSINNYNNNNNNNFVPITAVSVGTIQMSVFDPLLYEHIVVRL